MALDRVSKRDGSTVAFDPKKIESAIARALAATGEVGEPEALAREVSGRLEERFAAADAPGPGVEQVQDAVEETLAGRGLLQTARAYIQYRQRRAEIRQAKGLLGVHDALKLTVNAAAVLKKRYLVRNERGEISETPEELFRRVARAVAAAERTRPERERYEALFYDLLSRLDFLPNSPTLMNAGTSVGQLSACFVLPVEDSIPGIFDALKSMALVHKSGGGTGFSFSRLRPRGDLVAPTGGLASGPLSFMSIFDVTTGVIRQGGRRRGANMAILRCDHPDVIEFIRAKERDGQLSNFNLSVGITDAFMEALARDGSIALVNPKDGHPRGELRARDLFRLIVDQAWRSGDPGVVFLDAINRANPTPALGEIEATNPCGEQPLLPWESCNLGSLNLSQMIKGEALDRDRLRSAVTLAVRFLDDVIEVNRFPLEEARRITLGNRKIGLGVMGFADALLQLGLPYDSEPALRFAEETAALIQLEAHRASAALAEERGTFPNYPGSRWEQSGERLRNATVTTIAPTGTISIIAGCSSSIEPLFAVCFVRNVIEGTRLFETNPIFEGLARRRGFFSDDLLAEVARRGSLAAVAGVPEDVRRLFVTALDIAPEWHVRMQAAFQRHCDNAVSKTINFPPEATSEAVERAFRLAHAAGCKGITIYRYGSKREQVLYLGGDPALSALDPNLEGREYTTVDAEFSGGCLSNQCSI
jgi:ribonucleoside-diphosphate reductase alpha chain